MTITLLIDHPPCPPLLTDTKMAFMFSLFDEMEAAVDSAIASWIGEPQQESSGSDAVDAPRRQQLSVRFDAMCLDAKPSAFRRPPTPMPLTLSLEDAEKDEAEVASSEEAEEASSRQVFWGEEVVDDSTSDEDDDEAPQELAEDSDSEVDDTPQELPEDNASELGMEEPTRDSDSDDSSSSISLSTDDAADLDDDEQRFARRERIARLMATNDAAIKEVRRQTMRNREWLKIHDLWVRRLRRGGPAAKARAKCRTARRVRVVNRGDVELKIEAELEEPSPIKTIKQ